MLIYLTKVDAPEAKSDQEFERMYYKYHKIVWAKICKSVYDRQHCEEVLQDVFVKYYKSKGEFQSEAAAFRWLMVVTQSTIVDAIRKDTVYSNHISITLDDEDVFESCSDLWENGPLDATVNRELAEEVLATIRKLKPIHYEVVLMHYYMDFTPQEISERLHISVYTVYSRLSAAKSMLYHTISDSVKEQFVKAVN